MVDVNTQEKPKEDFYSSLQGPLNKAIGDIADPMVRLLRAKETSSQEEMKQKALREQTAADKRAEAARTFRDTQKQEFAKYDKLPERPKDTITQDTQQGLQGLAMLLPVAGLFLGAVGNTSGVNAMNAMTGILKGYKEGNDQRIAFETKKYESAIKEWEANYKKAKEGIDRAIEIAKTNYQAGVAEAEAAARKIGSTELAAMVRSKSLGEIQTMMNKVGQDFQTAKNKAETLAARPQRPIIVQDEEGKPMYASPSTGEPMLGPDKKPLRPAPKPASAGQNATIYANRVYGNIEGASQDLVNLANSPVSQAPIFAGIINADPTTISGSLRALVARKIAPEEDRVFDQLSQQIGLALSRLEGQGLASASTQAQVKGFDALRPKAGDSAINMALYLAKVRQEIETGVKVHSTLFGANPDQKENAKIRLKEIQNAIPFTVNDVLNVLRDNRETLSDSSQKLLSQPGIATGLQIESGQTRTQAVGTQPKIAKQEDVVATANARFGGDIEKAKKALRERGFEIEGD